MLVLSVVPAGGDADLTDLPCSRSRAPSWSPGRCRRRSPRAARSLLRNPPERASCTCGASSGRRLMAPASLHNNLEAARGTQSAWSTAPESPASVGRPQPVLGRYGRPTATPNHSMTRTKTAPVDDRPLPCSSPRSRCNLQHHPDGTPVADRSASACSCAADRAEFVPARPIAGGSGGRSQRSLP